MHHCAILSGLLPQFFGKLMMTLVMFCNVDNRIFEVQKKCEKKKFFENNFEWMQNIIFA